MATTNPVYNVLATLGNQAPLAAGNTIDQLANGQVGIFNFHTNKSIDGTVLGDAQDVFIAVGINRTSGGTALIEDFSKSAGQMIQTKRLRAYTVKGTSPEVPKVVVITGFDANCNTDYALKVEYRNQANYQTNGYNQIAETYQYRTSCCPVVGCVSCPQGDCTELAQGLVDNINADPQKILVASLFANKLLATIADPTTDGTAVIGVGTESFNVALLAADTPTTAAAKIAAAINSVTTSGYVASSAAAVLTVAPKKSVAVPTAAISVVNAGGTGVAVSVTSNTNTTISDLPAYKTAYPGSCPSIKLTANPEVRLPANTINVKYHKTGLDFIVSAIEGFNCNGVVTTTTPLQVKEGSGYDLKQLEYVAKGWGKPGPYRTNAITGLPNTVEQFIVDASNYTQISIAYDQKSVGGWLEYENNLETIIAIPCADTTTLTGLVAVLDRIFPQVTPMANDVAAMNCTSVNNISAINDPALDGIESLS